LDLNIKSVQRNNKCDHLINVRNIPATVDDNDISGPGSQVDMKTCLHVTQDLPENSERRC